MLRRANRNNMMPVTDARK